jgi:4-carboxymuconolactone decarboxylase
VAAASDQPRGGEEELLARGRAMLTSLNPAITVPPTSTGDYLAPDWLDWLIATAFGELWSRPNLTLQERERITLSVLVVLVRDRELASHVAIASNLGISPIEIGETIMHLAVYAGFPAAVEGMRVAHQVLDQRAT